MSRSNTANGGTSYFDLEIQTVSADASQYTLRAVIFLTSLPVTDTTNSLDVTGHWSRSGPLNLGGSYDRTPVWSQDISVARVAGDQTVTVNAAWSSVNYWGGTLAASQGYVVPGVSVPGGPPSPPTIAATEVTGTSARIFTTLAGSENGSTTTAVKYRVGIPNGPSMGDIEGGYGGVVYTNLAPGTAYVAYAQSYNSYGWGGWSQPAYFTTASGVPGQSAVTVYNITSSSAFIGTTIAPPANGAPIDYYLYSVYRVSDGVQIGDLQGPPEGVNFTGLAKMTQYIAYNYAHNANGLGPRSAGFQFTTLPTPPSAPTITSVTSVSPTSAVVSWTPPIDHGGQPITAYDVEYSTDNFATKVTQSSGTLTGLTPGVAYKTRVRAKNAAGPGPYSNVVSFNTATGIKYYTGTAWADAPVYAWNGTAWVACEVRIWNGTAWVPTG